MIMKIAKTVLRIVEIAVTFAETIFVLKMKIASIVNETAAFAFVATTVAILPKAVAVVQRIAIVVHLNVEMNYAMEKKIAKIARWIAEFVPFAEILSVTMMNPAKPARWIVETATTSVVIKSVHLMNHVTVVRKTAGYVPISVVTEFVPREKAVHHVPVIVAPARDAVTAIVLKMKIATTAPRIAVIVFPIVEMKFARKVKPVKPAPRIAEPVRIFAVTTSVGRLKAVFPVRRIVAVARDVVTAIVLKMKIATTAPRIAEPVRIFAVTTSAAIQNHAHPVLKIVAIARQSVAMESVIPMNHVTPVPRIAAIVQVVEMEFVMNLKIAVIAR